MKLITFISSGIYIVMAACVMQKDNNASQTPLYETKWSLKKIHEGSVIETVNTKAFLRFNKEKSSAGGNGSCNSFGSTATVQGANLSFKDIFSTKMYCEEVQKTEDAYFKQLASVTRFEIKNDVLILYNKESMLLEFQATTE